MSYKNILIILIIITNLMSLGSTSYASKMVIPAMTPLIVRPESSIKKNIIAALDTEQPGAEISELYDQLRTELPGQHAMTDHEVLLHTLAKKNIVAILAAQQSKTAMSGAEISALCKQLSAVLPGARLVTDREVLLHTLHYLQPSLAVAQLEKQTERELVEQLLVCNPADVELQVKNNDMIKPVISALCGQLRAALPGQSKMTDHEVLLHTLYYLNPLLAAAQLGKKPDYELVRYLLSLNPAEVELQVIQNSLAMAFYYALRQEQNTDTVNYLFQQALIINNNNYQKTLQMLQVDNIFMRALLDMRRQPSQQEAQLSVQQCIYIIDNLYQLVLVHSNKPMAMSAKELFQALRFDACFVHAAGMGSLRLVEHFYQLAGADVQLLKILPFDRALQRAAVWGRPRVVGFLCQQIPQLHARGLVLLAPVLCVIDCLERYRGKVWLNERHDSQYYNADMEENLVNFIMHHDNDLLFPTKRQLQPLAEAVTVKDVVLVRKNWQAINNKRQQPDFPKIFDAAQVARAVNLMVIELIDLHPPLQFPSTATAINPAWRHDYDPSHEKYTKYLSKQVFQADLLELLPLELWCSMTVRIGDYTRFNDLMQQLPACDAVNRMLVETCESALLCGSRRQCDFVAHCLLQTSSDFPPLQFIRLGLGRVLELALANHNMLILNEFIGMLGDMVNTRLVPQVTAAASLRKILLSEWVDDNVKHRVRTTYLSYPQKSNIHQQLLAQVAEGSVHSSLKHANTKMRVAMLMAETDRARRFNSVVSFMRILRQNIDDLMAVINSNNQQNEQQKPDSSALNQNQEEGLVKQYIEQYLNEKSQHYGIQIVANPSERDELKKIFQCILRAKNKTELKAAVQAARAALPNSAVLDSVIDMGRKNVLSTSLAPEVPLVILNKDRYVQWHGGYLTKEAE